MARKRKSIPKRLYAVAAILVCLTQWTTAMGGAPDHGAHTDEDTQYCPQCPSTRLNSARPTLHTPPPVHYGQQLYHPQPGYLQRSPPSMNNTPRYVYRMLLFRVTTKLKLYDFTRRPAPPPYPHHQTPSGYSQANQRQEAQPQALEPAYTSTHSHLSHSTPQQSTTERDYYAKGVIPISSLLRYVQ